MRGCCDESCDDACKNCTRGCKALVTLSERTSIAHHDASPTCTWPRAPNGLSNEHFVFGPHYLALFGELIVRWTRGGDDTTLTLHDTATAGMTHCTLRM